MQRNQVVCVDLLIHSLWCTNATTTFLHPPVVVDKLLPGPPQIETASLTENAPEPSVSDPPRTQDHKQEMWYSKIQRLIYQTNLVFKMYCAWWCHIASHTTHIRRLSIMWTTTILYKKSYSYQAAYVFIEFNTQKLQANNETSQVLTAIYSGLIRILLRVLVGG